jgi:hypothetical protein
MTSLGEYRVGIDFNPGKNLLVHKLKEAAADFIDMISEIEPAMDADPGEVERLKALAMTAIETGAMWAVKAATKPPMD